MLNCSCFIPDTSGQGFVPHPAPPLLLHLPPAGRQVPGLQPQGAAPGIGHAQGSSRSSAQSSGRISS